ncbi:MAG: SusE domain-containing protein [Mediterranea sp.]|jgi:hypothetical protein|nr:SusE domain-containing protein [Mediterranea sp.]
MKKIFNHTWLIASLSLLGAFALGACDSDTDSNPVLNEPTSFVLNTPANAANNVYDLGSASTVELTCSQPDYGFPASTTYSVQVALDGTFVEATDATPANYLTLTTTSTTARVAASASELNDALMDLWGTAHPTEIFPDTPIAVYLRLRAQITGSDSRGVAFSNVVELPKVLGAKGAPLTMPSKLFLLNGDQWSQMGKVNGQDEFFTIAYFDDGGNFKFGVKQGTAAVGTMTIATDGGTGAAIADDGTGGQMVQIANKGWYVVDIAVKIISNAYDFTFNFYPPNVYLSGNATGGSWGVADAWKFSVPADGVGVFVSPAMTGAGEVRMHIAVGDYDWWKTEFTLNNNAIFYRGDASVNDSWSQDVGAAYSVAGDAGKQMYIDFTNGTGEIK